MKIVVSVLNADPVRDILKCRYRTRSKEYAGQQLNEKQITKMFLGEESPIEVVQFMIECFDVPKKVRNQIFRHTKKLPRFFAETSREDLTGKKRDDNGNTNFIIVANPSALIEIAKLRLCYKTEKETRLFMHLLVSSFAKDGNVFARAMANVMAPFCVYQNGCKYRENGCEKSPFQLTTHCSTIEDRFSTYARERARLGDDACLVLPLDYN